MTTVSLRQTLTHPVSELGLQGHVNSGEQGCRATEQPR